MTDKLLYEIIEDPIFGQHITILAGPAEDADNKLRELYGVDAGLKNTDGRTFVIEDDNGERQAVLFYLNNPSSPGILKTVVHESIHTSWAVLKHLGIHVCQEHDEILAYHASWLAEAVLNLLKTLEGAQPSGLL